MAVILRFGSRRESNVDLAYQISGFQKIIFPECPANYLRGIDLLSLAPVL